MSPFVGDGVLDKLGGIGVVSVANVGFTFTFVLTPCIGGAKVFVLPESGVVLLFGLTEGDKVDEAFCVGLDDVELPIKQFALVLELAEAGKLVVFSNDARSVLVFALLADFLIKFIFFVP